MTDKLTWAQFAEKYKPKDGDKFLDDRGNEWLHRNGYFWQDTISIVADSRFAKITTCPLIPTKQKRKLWPALCHNSVGYWVTTRVFADELEAKDMVGKHDFVSWPAIPNADGSYTEDE